MRSYINDFNKLIQPNLCTQIKKNWIHIAALTYGSCRVSDQGTLHAFDLQNAQAIIPNSFNYTWNVSAWN